MTAMTPIRHTGVSAFDMLSWAWAGIEYKYDVVVSAEIYDHIKSGYSDVVGCVQ